MSILEVESSNVRFTRNSFIGYCGLPEDVFLKAHSKLLTTYVYNYSLVSAMQFFNNYCYMKKCDDYIPIVLACAMVSNSTYSYDDFWYKMDDNIIHDIINRFDGKLIIPSIITYVRSISDLLKIEQEYVEDITIIIASDGQYYDLNPTLVAIDIICYASYLFDYDVKSLVCGGLVGNIHRTCLKFIENNNSLFPVINDRILSKKNTIIGITLYEKPKINIAARETAPVEKNPIEYKKLNIIANGKNRIVTLRHFNGERVAIKKIIDDYGICEIAIMKCVESPFILSAKSFYFKGSNTYIVMEKAIRDLHNEITIYSGGMGNYNETYYKCQPVFEDYVIDLRDRRKIAKQIIQGVDCLHRHGIIHGDIKPQNILMFENKNIKLADFGLSKIGITERNDSRMKNKNIFSLWYRPYEFLLPNESDYLKYGAEVDMWAVGCVLIEMETGIVPFNGDNNKEMILKIDRLLERNLNWLKDGIFKEMILGMLNRDPENRLISSDALEMLNVC